MSTAAISDLSDEDLFERVQKRDEQAFRVLYRRYDRRLYAYCLRVVKDHELAEDTFQSIVAAVFEKRASFTGGSFAAWLFTIARNAAIKASTRRSRSQQTHVALDEANELADTTPEHDGLLHEALHRAVEKLPETHRTIIRLRYFEELSYDEIAERLSITLANVKVRLFRAKAALQQTMTPYLDDTP